MTLRGAVASDLASFRSTARGLLQAQVPPMQVVWEDAAGQRHGTAVQGGLFAALENPIDRATKPSAMPTVPARYLTLAEAVACHDDPARWQLLYALLWRLTHGEPQLLKIVTDPLVDRLLGLEKAVRHDAYKVKAFVRFRLTEDEGGEHYISWHKTEFPVLKLIAGFFRERFSVMRWTIITPYQSLHWDTEQLHWGPGLPSTEVPQDDVLEDVWKAYYRATFNPARIKLKAMHAQMPKKYWATMPETSIIADLLREAPARVQTMIRQSEGLVTSAADVLPVDRSLPSLAAAARICTACPLHCGTTQTVFGVGPARARLMLVGEQPGEQEDAAGVPFIGPAGQVLDRALEEAGIDRATLYVTNAVKHFKHWKRKDKAFHRNPDVRDIVACKPWLEAEIAAVQPQLVLALGASAGKSLLGHGFSLKQYHGKVYEAVGSFANLAPDLPPLRVRPSYHPAAILREPSEVRRRDLYQALVTDLILADREIKLLSVA